MWAIYQYCTKIHQCMYITTLYYIVIVQAHLTFFLHVCSLTYIMNKTIVYIVYCLRLNYRGVVRDHVHRNKAPSASFCTKASHPK